MGQPGVVHMTFNLSHLREKPLSLHSNQNQGRLGKYSVVLCPERGRTDFGGYPAVSATIPEGPLSFMLLFYICTDAHRYIVVVLVVP